MPSTMDPTQTDPRDVLVARADEQLASAHDQITRADQELARVHEQLSRLAQAARRPPDPQTNMTPLHLAVVNDVQANDTADRPSIGRRALRGFTGLLLAACIGVAAIAWQSSYGEAAKQVVAKWAPQLVAASSQPLQKPELPAQPSPPAIQAAAAEAAPQQPAPQQPDPPQPAPAAQAAPEDVTPPAAALPPDLAQLLQTMARDLATMGQGIEQLKTNQEQMARDNAKAAEQIKATQEQMTRVIAKVSEAKPSEAKASEAKASGQNLRPRISAAPPPRRTVAAMRKPVPTLPSPQAAAHPQVTTQPQVITQPDAEDPEPSPAPRPPMPLR
jgi:hypothetical protein